MEGPSGLLRALGGLYDRRAWNRSMGVLTMPWGARVYCDGADDGAFRIADQRGNFLEARIAAATTARVELRKWDGSEWREQGEEEEGGAWTWY